MIIPRVSPGDYERGLELYHAGRYWDAHEAWERPWLAEPRDSIDRAFLQGLIQCAAAALKASEGNEAGVRRLCVKSIANLERVAAAATGGLYRGVDVTELIEALRAHRPPSALTRQAP